jgi:hypothetical protein
MAPLGLRCASDTARVDGDQLVIDGGTQDRPQQGVRVGSGGWRGLVLLRMPATNVSRCESRQRLVTQRGQDSLIEQRAVQLLGARLQVAVRQPWAGVFGEGD